MEAGDEGSRWLRQPHGATAGIAERIATGLREARLSAEARPVAEVSEVGVYDAFVIGAAAYMFHWLKDAKRFVKRHHRMLAERPVWLFSSGPLGTDLVDEEDRDILEVTRPKEFDELNDLVHPRGERVFFGAWDPDAPPVGLGERLVRRMPASRTATPAGDLRDWPAIDAWAAGVAPELHAADAARPHSTTRLTCQQPSTGPRSFSLGRGNGSRKLVLPGYANHADKHGNNAYPSKATDSRYRPIMYNVAMSAEQIQQWATEAGPAAASRARAVKADRRGGKTSGQLPTGDKLSPCPRPNRRRPAGVTTCRPSQLEPGVTAAPVQG